MATVCVDEVDFTTNPGNGRLELNPHSEQNDVEAFDFLLNGAQDVFEAIVPFTPVIVPVSGQYLVTADFRGYAIITAAVAGTPVQAGVMGQVRLNNVVIAGTETMVTNIIQGAPINNQPALRTDGTGSCTRVLSLTGGQALSLWGKRVADPGTTVAMSSDTRGRCRISLIRIGGI